MRFYIIKQAISLLFVSTAFALRGGSVRSSQLVPDADLSGGIDVGILSSTAAADVDQYEVNRQKDLVLTTGFEEVSTHVSEVEDVETHDNARIPSLGMTEDWEDEDFCYVIWGTECKVCYSYKCHCYSYEGKCPNVKAM